MPEISPMLVTITTNNLISTTHYELVRTVIWNEGIGFAFLVNLTLYFSLLFVELRGI